MKLAEQNYRRSVDLLKKVVKADSDPSFSAGSERMRKLWEDSLAVVEGEHRRDRADQYPAGRSVDGTAAQEGGGRNSRGSAGKITARRRPRGGAWGGAAGDRCEGRRLHG